MFATSRAVLKLDLVYKHDMLFTQAGEIAGWEALDVPADTVIPTPPAIQNEVKNAFRSDLAVFTSGSSEAVFIHKSTADAGSFSNPPPA